MNTTLVMLLCTAFYIIGLLMTYLRHDEKKRLGYASPIFAIYECIIYGLTTALLITSNLIQ